MYYIETQTYRSSAAGIEISYGTSQWYFVPAPPAEWTDDQRNTAHSVIANCWDIPIDDVPQALAKAEMTIEEAIALQIGSDEAIHEIEMELDAQAS